MFTVYMHKTPSNKVYIGITSATNVNDRFGPGGALYRNQIFGRAIKKYGWENIEHIIIAENLSKEDAKQMEIQLISKYNATNPKFGYNRSAGGDIPVIYGKHHTEETRRKISLSHTGKVLSNEAKLKLSQSIHNLWLTDDYRTKQACREISESTREKLSMSHKGHVHTDEQKLKISESNKGKHYFTDEQRLQISEKVKAQHQRERELGIRRHYNTNVESIVGSKWYNNGIVNVRCKNGCPEGFVPGRIKWSTKHENK